MDVSCMMRGSFGQEHFAGAELGDPRRTARLVEVANQLAAQPGGTFPHKIPDPYDLDAFYRLMAAPQVTQEAVLAPHYRRTTQRMAAEPGVVLIVHDTTVLDFSGLHSIPELGQVGDGHGRGYYCHNSLALTPGRQVLGLARQILHTRRHVPAGETRAQRRQHPQCESRLWRDAVAALPAAPAGSLWVDVADRAADITEFLDYEDEHGRAHVVRSQHNRWVQVVLAGTPRRKKLHDWARGLSAVACREVAVSAQPGQPARRAVVQLAWQAVTVIPPRQARGRERGVPLPVWVLRVWEADPPAGVKPLEWILLTNVAVPDLAAAWERVDWYACRAVVEEYHKAMKTGCGVEQMQFRHAERLQPAIGLVSVVALLLLGLREAGRDAERAGQRATAWVPSVWVEVLARWRYGAPRDDLTVADFVGALGRLGGHQNRPSDGPPGWQTLWRGWIRLEAMVQGFLLLNSRNCGGT